MQTLSVVGAAVPELFATVADRLDGRVATLSRGTVATEEHGHADASITLSPDGDWTATVTGDSFDGVLDRLAVEYDYALIQGFSRLRLPTVVVDDGGQLAEGAAADVPEAPDDAPGDDPVPGDVVLEAEDASELDPDDLVELIESVEPYVTLETLVREAKAAEGAERSGAIATFTGRVRAKDSPDDDRTTHLAFEKYEGVAADRLETIERELEAREGVFDVRTHHRVGVIEDGEDIVFVVVLAGHREEAFRTVSDGIDRLKDEVPIFKKETTVEDEFWVHERD
jgi:molybdopterin synthase catalytic subunit